MDQLPPTNALPTATTIGIISKPFHVKLLQTLSISASAFVGGQTATVSFLLIPAILKTRSASLLARQWRAFFNRGLIIGPGLMLPSSAVFFWLAFREPSWRTMSARLYAAAGALLAGSIPYTTLLVNPTNKVLKRRSDEAERGDLEVGDVHEEYKSDAFGTFSQKQYGKAAPKPNEKSTHQLVDDWAWLNLGRGIMGTAAGLCGMWAVVSEDLSFFE